MVGEPLQLERHAAQHRGPGRDLEVGQGLHPVGVGDGVPHRGVAGDRLEERPGAPVGAAGQHGLDTAVLVAEDDLEREDVLAVALEAEVARLDHAGVHRPHRHLVDLLPLHAEEGVVARNGGRVRDPAPGVDSGHERRLEAERLQPGVALRPHAELLEDLPLEGLERGALGGERGPGGAHPAGEQAEPALGVVGQHRRDAGAVAVGAPRVARDPGPGGDGVGHDLLELVDGEDGDVGGFDRLGVPGLEDAGGHVRLPSPAARRPRRDPGAGGGARGPAPAR